MYHSFTIKKFRCFRDLTLTPLERVNLIAGINNVGKTALLEALFLHLGPNNPDLSLRLYALRGVEQFAIDAEEIWGWLFYGKRINETIELASEDEEGMQRFLDVRLAMPERLQVTPPGNGNMTPGKVIGSLTTAMGPSELKLEYRDATGQTGISRAFIGTDGIKLEHARLAPFPLGVFLGSRARFPQENIERFSKLEAIGRQDEVVTTLQILEPRLRRLAVLVKGGVPMIYGDVGVGELMPLPLMGEGVVRLLSVLLAIANAPRGTVLVDEIENGLHYSVMVDVWKAIADAARRSETQVFATTHSWECIRAAHEAFTAGGQYDFRLHRLDRAGDDIRAVTYDQKKLALALESGLEVR
jgi:hypothetical protein